MSRPVGSPTRLLDAEKIISRYHYEFDLQTLEKEKKLFAAHNLNAGRVDGKSLAKFIDIILKDIVGCSVPHLNDDGLKKRIGAAFFKDKKVIDECMSKSRYPMFEGLLLCLIFNNMRNLFTKIHEHKIAEEYETLRDQMDIECTNLLQTCFCDNEEKALLTLEINYHQRIHSCKCEKTNYRMSLMEIAYLGKAYKFLAHPACQKAIDLRWQPSYRLGSTSYLLYFYWFLPVFLLIPSTQPSFKTVTDSQVTRLREFYQSAHSKYILHMIFRLVYMLIYSVALILLSGRNFKKENINEFIPQFIVMTWQCSYVFEMFVIAVKGKFFSWAQRNKLDFNRNIVIVINIIVFVIVPPSIRFKLPVAHFFFYVSYIMAVISWMRILHVDYFFGSIVYMISKMAAVMLKFFLIFVFFWLAFAVCYISLSGHVHSTNVTLTSIPWQFFYHGAFEIFGEADEDDKKGVIDYCNKLDTHSFSESYFYCLFRSWMLPLILFLYILVTGTLLVNLLTARLTAQHDDISKAYPIYWKVALYARLTEYEERPFIPEPLSVLYHLGEFIVYAFSASFRLLKVVWRKCCCSTVNNSDIISFKQENQPLSGKAGSNIEYGRPPEEAQPSEQLIKFIIYCRDIMLEAQEQQLTEIQELQKLLKTVLKDFDNSNSKKLTLAPVGELEAQFNTLRKIVPNEQQEMESVVKELMHLYQENAQRDFPAVDQVSDSVQQDEPANTIGPEINETDTVASENNGQSQNLPSTGNIDVKLQTDFASNAVPKYLRSEVRDYSKPNLGYRTAGRVLKVFHPFIGTAVFKKPQPRLDHAAFAEHWKRETENIYSLNHHPYIVGLYGYVYKDLLDPLPMGILMEYMPGGNLYGFIDREVIKNEAKAPSNLEKNTWSKQIALGMNFIHSRNILHRDLRPHNVYFNHHRSVAKIGDFGLSTSFGPEKDKNLSKYIGDPIYGAPELSSEGEAGYSEKVDVWSYGMVLYFIHYCRHPFDDSFVKKPTYMRGKLLMGDRFNSPLRPPLGGKNIDKFIEMCWRTDPAERCTMGDVVRDFHNQDGLTYFPTYSV